MTNIPRHIAVIMDGNGRWAKAQGQDRLHGHIKGAESVRTCIKAAIKNKIQYLTLYAFSTENWGRPQQEIEGLMELLCRYTRNETPELKEQGVKMIFIGDLEQLSQEVKESIKYSMEQTAECTKLTLIIALNYSSRWEITRMVKVLATSVSKGVLSIDDITTEKVSENLTTRNIPDPDLLIRTSGECRLSNFLLWQCAYSELYFTEVLWPDFSENDFEAAIKEYKQRNRRFGLI